MDCFKLAFLSHDAASSNSMVTVSRVGWAVGGAGVAEEEGIGLTGGT